MTLGLANFSAHARPRAVQASAIAQLPASSLQSYEGIVTDTKCGAKHSTSVGKDAADCTRVCVHGGEQFALVDGDKAFVLACESARLKRVAGERVKILGTLNANTISVASVVSPAP
jgi:hypothetical protein